MGVILAALASITSQWLPNWNRGIARAQRSRTGQISTGPTDSRPRVVGIHLAEPRCKSPVVRWNGIFCHPCTISHRTQYPSWSRNRAHRRDRRQRWTSIGQSNKAICSVPLNTILPRLSDFANQTVLLRSPYQFRSPTQDPTTFGKTIGRMPITYLSVWFVTQPPGGHEATISTTGIGSRRIAGSMCQRQQQGRLLR